MKILSFYLPLLGVLIAVSCNPKSSESSSENATSEQVETVASDAEEKKGFDFIESMRKGSIANDLMLTEDQMTQIEAIAEEINLDLNKPKSEFKESVKTLRERIYNEILTDEQKETYKKAGGKEVLDK